MPEVHASHWLLTQTAPNFQTCRASVLYICLQPTGYLCSELCCLAMHAAPEHGL